MIVFLRHGEPRQSETDPGLTSAGVRMARQAAAWAVEQLPSSASVRVLHTPTRRTAETAAAVLEWLEPAPPLESVERLPESLLELDILVRSLSGSLPGLPPRPVPPTVLVGHHTSLVGLCRELMARTPSARLPSPRRFAAGLALTQPDGHWVVRAMWPGHPS